ncbi:MAG TPA: NAD(P)-binding domain-containing protein, partial [Gaiellaceae bacterium]|nr:NAD(P)-binding domain-containing protein [Gaiellaceae bacterium]
MELGFVGLGRMGGNMVTRLVRGGHRVVAYDPSPNAAKLAAANGAELAPSLADLPRALARPRVVWVMVPAGDPTESAIRTLAEVLAPGDTIVDGGNTKWKDDVRRGRELAPRGLAYVDAGTSGGIWGLQNGYCLMV